MVRDVTPAGSDRQLGFHGTRKETQYPQLQEGSTQDEPEGTPIERALPPG
jgi:hypothetical protein